MARVSIARDGTVKLNGKATAWTWAGETSLGC
jgi:hypothetical protein